ncbi:OsmC family protein [Mucilaginibacter robiniae]|uniref:OsmC family protein n=1 Tax=Mucilaginibacter robiniae TaxID=2728022 RepID=A0A7L5E472_9SPHI|nr:OsmC family protein [Mucilaginibacter robiniae]QJD97885.1 OsmC family protein [Mucilaginibacter robiniae]
MDLQKKLITKGFAHIGREHYHTTAGSGKHTIVVDEPAEMQGTDAGMNPFGLLVSSLGSCTIITLRMYIDRKGWPVDEIQVDLAMYSITGGYLIERNLTIKGNLTEDQLKRLEQIADACPIHKVLTGSVMVETHLQ